MARAEKVYDQTFTARNFNTSPLTISGLEGDLYDYECWIFTSNVSSNTGWEMECNSDVTSNYRNYRMGASGSSVLGNVNDSVTEIRFGNSDSARTGNTNLLHFEILGSSGDERYIPSFYGSGGDTLYKPSDYWKNTADELTSIDLQFTGSATADAHIILYRTPKEASQEKWELIQEGSISQDTFTTPYDITGLDGNADKVYRLVVSNVYVSTTPNQLLQLNGDSGSNYIEQELYNTSGSIAANNATQTGVDLMDSEGSTRKATQEIIINAESGVKRLIQFSGAQIDSSSGYLVQVERACWWSNTVDNLTSLRFTLASSATHNLDFKLYRRKNPNTIGDTLPFEMVEEESFSSTDWSAGSTYTVSGDDVLLYKIEGLLSNTSGDIEIRMELNSDTAANYPEQLLKGDTSTTSAASATRNYIVLAKLQNGDQAQFNHYLYPKSGENRPMLTECSYDENALEKLAQWWNNSADSISSIKIYASSSNAITGTLKLSRLMRSDVTKTITVATFDGTNDTIDMSSQYIPASSTKWTVEGWIERDATGTRHGIIYETDSTGATRFVFEVDSSNNLSAGYRDTAGGSFISLGTSTSTLSANTLYHVKITVDTDANEAKFYIDDSLDATNAFTGGSIAAAGSNHFIGASGKVAGRYMDGNIFNVLIFDAIKTDSSASMDANGNPRFISNIIPDVTDLVSAWPFCDDVPANGEEFDDQQGSNDGTNQGTTFGSDTVEFSTY